MVTSLMSVEVSQATTGTGPIVLQNGPTFSTPALGNATGTQLTLSSSLNQTLAVVIGGTTSTYAMTTFQASLASGAYVENEIGISNTVCTNLGYSNSATPYGYLGLGGGGVSLQVFPRNTVSTSGTTGAIVVQGGLGVTGAGNFNGALSTNNGTNTFTYSENTVSIVANFITGTYPNSLSFTSSGITTVLGTLKYAKIGRMVQCALYVLYNYNANSAAGVSLSGLPFTPAQDTVAICSPQSNFASAVNDFAIQLSVLYPTQMLVTSIGSGGGLLTPQVLGATSQFVQLCFSYYTTS
jgi:hypothetical protein